MVNKSLMGGDFYGVWGMNGWSVKYFSVEILIIIGIRFVEIKLI